MTDHPLFASSHLEIKNQTGEYFHDTTITPAISDEDDVEVRLKLAELIESDEIEDYEIADIIDEFLKEKGYKKVLLDVRTYILNPMDL
jgi:type I site-specific restriction-modification system R (restriction) subunit